MYTFLQICKWFFYINIINQRLKAQSNDKEGNSLFFFRNFVWSMSTSFMFTSFNHFYYGPASTNEWTTVFLKKTPTLSIFFCTSTTLHLISGQTVFICNCTWIRAVLMLFELFSNINYFRMSYKWSKYELISNPIFTFIK